VHGLSTLLTEHQIRPEMIVGGSVVHLELTKRFRKFLDFSRP
tara:strand:+ start:819 stop:944 length:126 start_codon:yes stop_codon:yes gene_type:complete